jgi:HSP20 family molecular chaperone IbpA
MRLPEYVDSEKTEAEYRNGVLNIKLEKKPESAPKKIEVKSGQ